MAEDKKASQLLVIDATVIHSRILELETDDKIHPTNKAGRIKELRKLLSLFENNKFETEKVNYFLDNAIKYLNVGECFELINQLNVRIPDLYRMQPNDTHKNIIEQLNKAFKEAHDEYEKESEGAAVGYSFFHELAARKIELITEDLQIYNVKWWLVFENEKPENIVGCKYNYSILQSTYEFGYETFFKEIKID